MSISSPSRPARRRLGLAVAAVLAVLPAALAAAPASAATQVAGNACRYSYDGLFRDMPLSITSSSAIVPDASYPSPTQVVAGQTVRTAAGTFRVELPAYLASFGYAVGLLTAGDTEIHTSVWLAIEGTNTKERVQVLGPFDVVARTTITVDPADDNRFLSATPWAYSDPVVPELTWTAVGGDVAFRQAGAGALPSLPTGPGGALRRPLGSAVIQARLAGGANLVMDCQPGATTGIEFDFAGPSFAAAPAPPFDVEQGPRNLMCVSELGRQVSGDAASFPGGIDRELDPLAATLSATGTAPQFATGAPYALTGAQAHVTLSPETVATLGRFEDGGAPLVRPDATYPLGGWVTIAATNTVEGTRTVRADATWSPHPAVTPVTPTSPWEAEEVVIALHDTTWTPTGAGPIRFALAQPGTSAPVELTGPVSGAPGGPVVGTTYAATPYGSLLLRTGTERNAATLDCAPAAVAVANAGIAWSALGRLAPPAGSGGRYAIDANLDAPAFAVVTDGAPPVVPPRPPIDPPGPPVVDPPARRPALVPAGAIRSGSLVARRGAVRLRLACPRGGGTCRGTVLVRTAARARLARGRRARVVTLVRSTRYTLAAGRERLLTLPLTRDARRLLRRRASVGTIVTLRSGSATATRRLSLTR